MSAPYRIALDDRTCEDGSAAPCCDRSIDLAWQWGCARVPHEALMELIEPGGIGFLVREEGREEGREGWTPANCNLMASMLSARLVIGELERGQCGAP